MRIQERYICQYLSQMIIQIRADKQYKLNSMSSDFSEQQFGPTIKPVPSPPLQQQCPSSFCVSQNGQSSQKNDMNSSQNIDHSQKYSFKRGTKAYCPSQKAGPKNSQMRVVETGNQGSKKCLIENTSTTITQIQNNNKTIKYKLPGHKNNILNQQYSNNIRKSQGQQYQNSKINNKGNKVGFQLTNIKKLTQDDNFYCICQNRNQNKQKITSQQPPLRYGYYDEENQKNRQCIICGGTGQTNGSSKLVKFMQYIMEFKLGKKPAYRNQILQEIQRSNNSKIIKKQISKQEYLQQCDISKMMPISTSKHSRNTYSNNSYVDPLQKEKKKIVTLSHKATVLNNRDVNHKKSDQKVNQFCVQYIKSHSKQKQRQQQEQVDSKILNNQSQVEVYNLSSNSYMNQSIDSKQNSKLIQTRNTINTNQSINSCNKNNSVSNLQNQNMKNSIININVQENVSTINLGIDNMAQSLIHEQANLNYQKKKSKQAQLPKFYGASRGNNNDLEVNLQKLHKQQKFGISRQNNYMVQQIKSRANQSSQICSKSIHLPYTSSLHQSHFDSKHDNPRLSLQPTPTFKNLNQFCSNLKEQSQVHTGFGCDICQVYPIVGWRYHCTSFLCGGDYDLCQCCYKKHGHKHRMEEIRRNKNVDNICQSLQILSSKSIKSSYRLSVDNAARALPPEIGINININNNIYSSYNQKQYENRNNSPNQYRMMYRTGKCNRNQYSIDNYSNSSNSSNSQNENQYYQINCKPVFKSSIS